MQAIRDLSTMSSMPFSTAYHSMPIDLSLEASILRDILLPPTSSSRLLFLSPDRFYLWMLKFVR